MPWTPHGINGDVVGRGKPDRDNYSLRSARDARSFESHDRSRIQDTLSAFKKQA
ncbi:hypothetical protein FHT98_4688 [Bosea sp. AK1]|nr:hypothetical protein FHT98_4688 [Bosea sp. AK1]